MSYQFIIPTVMYENSAFSPIFISLGLFDFCHCHVYIVILNFAFSVQFPDE